MNDVIDFDADPDFELDWEQQFQIKGVTYTARVADGLAAEKYRDAQIKGSVFRSQSKEVAIGSIGSVENVLVAYTCWDDKDRRVGSAVVQKWPAPVIGRLYDMIKDKSHLSEEDQNLEDLLKEKKELEARIALLQEDNLGNSQPDTMFGSD